jgi:hypothetical protein
MLGNFETDIPMFIYIMFQLSIFFLIWHISLRQYQSLRTWRDIVLHHNLPPEQQRIMDKVYEKRRQAVISVLLVLSLHFFFDCLFNGIVSNNKDLGDINRRYIRAL